MLFKKGHTINLGRKMSDETKKKIGEANAGRISIRKGTKSPEKHNEYSCKECKKTFSAFKSNKISGFCSKECYWQSKKGTTGYWLGRKRSFEDRKKISENRKGKLAPENHPNWKGGISSANSLARSSFEYKEWRKAIFRRDGWRCVLCRYRSCKRKDIEADHIKRFADYPELRHEVANGRTLCVPCHKKITFNHE